MKNLTGILLLGLLLPGLDVDGQFYGGEADGSGSERSIPGTMFPQEIYCSGGDADGFQAEGSGLITLNQQDLYCQGGDSDGYSSAFAELLTFNNQLLYCCGGNYDGTSNSLFDGYFFDPLEVYDGGDGDGSTGDTFDGYFYEWLFTSGGTHDGGAGLSSGMTSINEQDFYCAAGSGDGFSSYLFSGHFMPWLYCWGGNGDGFRAASSTLEELGLGIWTGFTSTEWSEPNNWKLNTVPTSTINVLIPGGAPYYPVLLESLSVNDPAGFYECQRLDIYPQGILILWNGLIVNGILNVSGTLELQRQTGNALQVEDSGEVTVKAAGEVVILEF